ncbi:MAG: DinB family protein [Armatimonadetes bacterium]|nr:DinB family protein [Armatimonadota bacterium]MBX3107850.1 DinB family protein [Fimbriimonadaceae bacterium]
MDSRELLKSRLAYVRRDLDEAVSRLTDEDMGWAPAEGMRTIGGQLHEIAATELQDIALFRGETTRFDEIAKGAKRGTLAEYKELLAATRGELIALIDSLSEADLAKPLQVDPRWFESFGNSEVPLAEAIRSVAMHEWYHTAQLVSYLWAKGDNPYDWGKEGAANAQSG